MERLSVEDRQAILRRQLWRGFDKTQVVPVLVRSGDLYLFLLVCLFILVVIFQV